MVVISLREKRYFYLTPQDYELAEKNGIGYHTLNSRVQKHGWDIQRAITQPVQKRNKEGKRWNEWKDKAVVGKSTYLSRVNKGWTFEEAALKPAMSFSEASKMKRKYSEEDYRIARENGISQGVVRYRVSRMGWSIEKAITTPVMNKSQSAKLAMKSRWNIVGQCYKESK